MTLIEVMIVSLIMGVLAFAMMTMSSNQMKSNNFSEFQNKREQLRLVLLGQVLNGSDNCKCLFTGAAEFPAAAPLPGVTLTGYTAPTALGKFSPVDCSGGIPAPFVNADGIDGLKLASVSLTNITFTGGTYSGDFTVGLRSTKDVLGPKDLQLKIPVLVSTAPGTPGNVTFVGCSIAPPSTLGRPLDCYTTAWGALSACTNPGVPVDFPSCNAGYISTGIADYTQSDSGCGASSLVRSKVKSRCCRILEPDGSPSLATLSCSSTAWGATTASCSLLPDVTLPSCPAGDKLIGLANYRQSDAGCGSSDETRAAAQSRCCHVTGASATLLCSQTNWSSQSPKNYCDTFPECNPPDCQQGAFTALSGFSQSDSGCGVSSRTTSTSQATCCRVQ